MQISTFESSGVSFYTKSTFKLLTGKFTDESASVCRNVDLFHARRRDQSSAALIVRRKMSQAEQGGAFRWFWRLFCWFVFYVCLKVNIIYIMRQIKIIKTG